MKSFIFLGHVWELIARTKKELREELKRSFEIIAWICHFIPDKNIISADVALKLMSETVA